MNGCRYGPGKPSVISDRKLSVGKSSAHVTCFDYRFFALIVAVIIAVMTTYEGSRFDAGQFDSKMNEQGIYAYGFEKPSAIQQRGIVPFIKGLDVIEQAQSGTGKTATFCTGILQLLDYNLVQCQAIVLASTRELAQQIEKVMRALGDYLGVRVHACVGGNLVREDQSILAAGVHVVVGTPRRVFDLLKRRSLRADYIKMLVLDEAIEKGMRALGDYLGVRVHACVGGNLVREDQSILAAGVHVVVVMDTRQFDSKMDELLSAEGQDFFTSYDEVIETFDAMGLLENLLRGIYAYGFEKPSAIQQRGIVPFTKGLDVIQQAESGTGKTATFCSGILQQLLTVLAKASLLPSAAGSRVIVITSSSVTITRLIRASSMLLVAAEEQVFPLYNFHNLGILQALRFTSEKEDAFTSYAEISESFDVMGLLENLLRGIHAYVLRNHWRFSKGELCPSLRDVIEQAQSGTGKTATFCTGILQLLDYNLVQCQAIVLAHTHELAQQIKKVMRALGDYLGVRVHACVGGNLVREDQSILAAGVHVVVGTPGRVFDLLKRRSLRADYIKMLVLDEAVITLSAEGQDFFTSYDEVTETFDAMGLLENLLRGIYAYGFEKPFAI
nr:eukaryotic initiation factor 4A-15-like [Tanacetum cinerariifolium]